ncbi:amino acid ABC transporter substrate-binding protein (PAAT family) [Glaciihabitans tibetensis]|uniref:Amino acid ABC transporter substrate-binding protein (PAAT family) n=1 Tax=Glaciihabitans tibetensis TaxID=1266600 RepID=A0A2T0V6X9_9MICO|nr:ABC transporter substrate-binding protein [Glaciihabitans tibetensis]PRY65867.1 amino acid ABC transporter substrate-binding protein (PAAT family) [Glaciihabitans tibetensis]
MRHRSRLRIAALIGSTLTVAALVGCSSEAAAPTATSTANPEIAALVPTEMAESGLIRVATDGAYPPFVSISEDDGETLVGLDADLAREMASLMGLEVEFVITSFDGLIPSLQAGTNDMAMNSIGDTKEREQAVDFVTYYHNGTVALVESGNPLDVTAEALCGARVAVNRGSLQQSTMLPPQSAACEADGKEAPTEAVFAGTPEALLALTAGQVDAVLADVPTLVLAQASNDAFEIAGPAFKNPNPGGVALPKDSEFAAAVHAAMTELMENGTYEEIIAKYELEDIAIDESVINGAIS